VKIKQFIAFWVPKRPSIFLKAIKVLPYSLHKMNHPEKDTDYFGQAARE
jgi:hypothetical protein